MYILRLCVCIPVVMLLVGFYMLCVHPSLTFKCLCVCAELLSPAESGSSPAVQELMTRLGFLLGDAIPTSSQTNMDEKQVNRKAYKSFRLKLTQTKNLLILLHSHTSCLLHHTTDVQNGKE